MFDDMRSNHLLSQGTISVEVRIVTFPAECRQESGQKRLMRK